MKMKAKFDKAALIGFFANNGEKIVFGIVVLLFFMFVWNAFQCERYKKQPEELKRAAEQARQHIENSPPEVVRPIVDYELKIKEISDPIVSMPYKLKTIMEPPIFPPLRKRGQPVLFPVEGLAMTPGHGVVRDANSRGVGGNPGMMTDNDPAGKRWVVITGVIDKEKYLKSYQDCFEDVHPKRPTDSFPEFLGYRVQRAEVTDENQDPATLKWDKPYEEPHMQTYVARYTVGSGSRRDQTYPDCIINELIFPLPSREDNRNWGEEVLHAPEIPMVDPSEAQYGTNATHGNTPEETPEGAGGDVPFDVPGFGAPRAGGVGGGDPLLAGGMGGFGPGRNRTNLSEEIEAPPYLLFRFFDFNVEPHKKYRYRVQLYLRNPNYGIEERYLDPELATRSQDSKQWFPYIVSSWSEPSDVITIPLDDSLLIQEVNTVTRSGELKPTGKITAIHWDFQKGLEVFDEFDVERGMVVNFYDEKMPDNAANKPIDRGIDGDALGAPAPRGGTRQPQDKVDYVTDMLVLDLKGGDPLPGNRSLKWNRPSSILLFTPDGAMKVQSSVKDKEEIEMLENPQKRRNFGGPGMETGVGGGDPLMLGP